MYYIDYHTHSLLSPDSSAPLEDMAQAAVNDGIDELCVTDHYDVVDQDGKVAPPLDWSPLVAQYRRVKEQFRGRLTLKLGLEFGTGYRDGSALDAAPEALDFVIGSLHNFSEQSGLGDFYYGNYETPARCYAALDDYFAQMALLAPLAAYDVLGHIIYPMRYMPHQLRLDAYMDRLEAILRIAIQSGRGIEVNTYRGQTLEEWRPVLALYRRLGGELVTVGSDAHVPKSMGLGVREAYALLRDTGFGYVTTYEKRQPTQIKL